MSGADSGTSSGRIVWHDLMSTDPEASKRFYGELFGWAFPAFEQWSFIARSDSHEGHFGTLMRQEAPGAPSLWVPYLCTGDIDAAIARATAPEAGGRVLVPRTPAGSTGVFSYLFDPQGAVFSLWQYAPGRGKDEPDGPPPVGSFCWDELLTSDPGAARGFYERAVGWSGQTMPMPGMDYTVFTRAALGADGKPRQAAGMMPMPPGVPQPFWLSYVFVEDCDKTLEHARTLGGNTPMPPVEMPNIGRFSTILDPTGAAIGVLGPGR